MAELKTSRRGARRHRPVLQPAEDERHDLRHVAARCRRCSPSSTPTRRCALIVCAGDGEKAFISGADISQFEKLRGTVEAQVDYNKAVERAYLAPMSCSKPVIARIRGICIGGGLGFAAACDLRICSEDSIFRMPAARLGLGYSPAGVRRFMNVLGAANTIDIFMSARKFDAKEALRMGFVSQVVPVAELDEGRRRLLQAGGRERAAHRGRGQVRGAAVAEGRAGARPGARP